MLVVVWEEVLEEDSEADLVEEVDWAAVPEGDLELELVLELGSELGQVPAKGSEPAAGSEPAVD